MIGILTFSSYWLQSTSPSSKYSSSISDNIYMNMTKISWYHKFLITAYSSLVPGIKINAWYTTVCACAKSSQDVGTPFSHKIFQFYVWWKTMTTGLKYAAFFLHFHDTDKCLETVVEIQSYLLLKSLMKIVQPFHTRPERGNSKLLW